MLGMVKRYFLVSLAASLLLLGLAACASDEPILGIGKITATPTLAATTSQATAAPVATPRVAKADKGRMVDIFPELANLPDNATELTVLYSWNGLNRIAPITANYSLKRSGSLFEGEGSVNAGGYRDNITKFVKVMIPSDTSREFLRILTETPVEAGEYRGSPIATHTDNYPNWNIAVTLPGGRLSFSSNSQQPGFYPWTVWYNGKQYTSTNDKPNQAYLEIASYLKQTETLDIIRSEIEAKQATPRP
jgi:hypothetical protein